MLALVKELLSEKGLMLKAGCRGEAMAVIKAVRHFALQVVTRRCCQQGDIAEATG